MPLERLIVGPIEANCYIVWEDPNRAIVIDPGGDPKDIAEFLEKNKLRVECYLLTHGHADHISALNYLLKRFPAPVGIHPADAKWAFQPANHILPYYPPPAEAPKEFLTLPVDSKGLWSVGGLEVQVIFTPGHTPGGVCYYFPRLNILFSGDTLFQGSVGRTDLPGGNSRQLAESLKRLTQLPDQTTVYTGHGHYTTIGDEKKFNYYLRN